MRADGHVFLSQAWKHRFERARRHIEHRPHSGSPAGTCRSAAQECVPADKPLGHGALHDFLPGLSSHVVMTYYGADQEIAWRTDGKRFSSRTRVRTITLIPEGQDGRWDIGGPIEVSHVYLPDERIQAAAQALNCSRGIELIGRVAFDDPAAARILELLSREAKTEDLGSRLFMEQAVDLLCTQLVRGHSSLGALEADAPRGLADWQVKRVTTYMREHLSEEVGLEELANLAGLSRFHFCSAFRQATGQSPHAWLVAQRTAESRRLLAMPELPITEVALAVGYPTPSAFTAAFRKITGMTPSDYRRQLEHRVADAVCQSAAVRYFDFSLRGVAENRASRRALREIW